MNSIQIYKILHSKIGESFCGVFPSDKLPKKIDTYPACFVMNTDPANKPGVHWVAVYVDSDKNGEYFDSYGRPSEISEKLLRKYSKYWQCNTKRLQGMFSSVCGQYCIYFLLQRHYGEPMAEIVAKFTENHEENDFLVTEWVNENFDSDTDTYDIDFIVNQICRALFME